MKRRVSGTRQGTWRVCLLAALLAALAYYLLPGSAPKIVVFVGSGAALVGAMIAGVRRNRPERPRYWYLLLAGVTLQAAANGVWFPFSVVQRRLPFPSVNDALYLVAYVLLAAGLALVVRDRTRGGDLTALSDGLVIALGAGALSWVLLIAPSALNAGLPPLARLVSAAYPGMDVLLLAAAAALALSRGPRESTLWLLVTFAFLQFLADSSYTLESLHGTFSPASGAFAGYILAYGCLAAAALHPSMGFLSHPASDRQGGRSRLLMLGAVTLIAPAAGALGELEGSHGSSQQAVLFLISGTLFLLVLSRASWVEGKLAAARARAVAASLEREARFRSFVQNSSDLTLACDGGGVLTYVSPASRRILGIDDAWLTGQRVAELAHPDDRAVLEERLGATVEQGDGHGTLTCRMSHADGSFRTVEVTFTNLLEDDAVSGLVMNLRDVTDRHRLETELRHAQKLESVGQLAAGIAHEINTPVQFVGDNVRFLRDAFDGLCLALEPLGVAPDGGPGDAGSSPALDARADLGFLTEEVPLAIDQTLQGVERIATIVRAMKAFGHPSGEQKAPADLNQAVRDTLIVANNPVKYVADVVTELGDLPPVWCHLGDINQVLLNLIVNASQAIAEAMEANGRGTITVRTSCDGAEVAIEVGDTGVGIPPEIAERIFEPFFTTKVVGEGTGQGLSLAYSLVHDRHGGSIGFETEPGAGTTFTVRLPVGSAPSPPEPPNSIEGLDRPEELDRPEVREPEPAPS